MKPHLLALPIVAATAVACVSVDANSGQSLLVVSPILDSMFVGDILPPRTVYVLAPDGSHKSPGPVTWSISPSSVASIDANGQITGLSKGMAVVVAEALGVQSPAVVAVSRPFDMTLLMDTVVLMPPDNTLLLPEFIAIKQKVAEQTTLWFDPSPAPSVYTVDSATGRVTAIASGGPVRYVARLANSTDTIADTGAVVVVSLADTNSAGRFFVTAVGTVLLRQSGAAVAQNYTRLNFNQAFRLADTAADGGTLTQQVLVTLPDPVLAPGTFEIDSLNPFREVGTRFTRFDPFCNPPRPWGVWDSPLFGVTAYSHGTPVAGQLIITQLVPVTGGAVIGGRYVFTAQRTDLYVDPLGSETVRGTFVAPLRTRSNTCQA